MRLQTVNGDYFDLDYGSEFDIHVIAHSLSNICRFNGHTKRFYSVAQHAVICSHIGELNAYLKLMHDCAEAYAGDMATPIKIRNPDYVQLEKSIETRLFRAFNLGMNTKEYLDEVAIGVESVKRADLIALVTEKRDLLPWHPEDDTEWSWVNKYNIEPLGIKISPVSPRRAKHMFLARFFELCPERFLKHSRTFHVMFHSMMAI